MPKSLYSSDERLKVASILELASCKVIESIDVEIPLASTTVIE